MSDYGGIVVNGTKSVQIDPTIKDLCILFSATSEKENAGHNYPATNIPVQYATIDHSQIPDYVSTDDVLLYGAVVTPTKPAIFAQTKVDSGIYVNPKSGTTRTKLITTVKYASEIFAVGFAGQQKPDYGIVMNSSGGSSSYSSQFKSLRMILHDVREATAIFRKTNSYIDINIPTNISKLGVIANMVPTMLLPGGGYLNAPGRLMGCKCEMISSSKLRFTTTQAGVGPPNDYGVGVSNFLDIILVDCSHL